MKWLTALLKKDKKEEVLDSIVDESKSSNIQDSNSLYGNSVFYDSEKDEMEEESEEFTEEERNRGMDEVYLARQSNDLEKMLKATELETTLNNRHFLLQAIVSETYKLRNEKKHENLCLKFSEKHLEEFDIISQSLKGEFNGSIPRVTTFQHYSTLLTELGDYEKALKICEMAISYRLDDGTKGGYQGRIDKIKKKMISK